MVIPLFLRKPLEDYRKVLREMFGSRLRDVRLFGSYARGEATEDSDIDVFVMISWRRSSSKSSAVASAFSRRTLTSREFPYDRGEPPRRDREGARTRRPGISGSGAHLSSVLRASDIAAVSRAATYRDLTDYERTWNADAETTRQAFAELDALIARARAHLAAGGWMPAP